MKPLTASQFLNISYFLVLELPFNLLLVYNTSFSHLADAEEIQSTLPYFKIWDSTSLDNWPGKKLRVPLKRNKGRNVYFISVTGLVPIEAATPDEANNIIRTRLKNLKFSNIITRTIKQRKALKDDTFT